MQKHKFQSDVEYAKLIKLINESRSTNITKFYKILNNILKYKEKRLITKQLKKNGIIQNKEESSKISLEFYKILLNWNDKMTQRWFRNNMNYEIDTKRELLKTANGKAVGIDKVPGE